LLSPSFDCSKALRARDDRPMPFFCMQSDLLGRRFVLKNVIRVIEVLFIQTGGSILGQGNSRVFITKHYILPISNDYNVAAEQDNFGKSHYDFVENQDL
jgi:hypothetical protein